MCVFVCLYAFLYHLKFSKNLLNILGTSGSMSNGKSMRCGNKLCCCGCDAGTFGICNGCDVLGTDVTFDC